MFENLVHHNEEISGVQKLYYLKKVLTGVAAEYPEDLSISEQSYQEAWKNLCNWYENKRAIIREYLGDLFALPKLKSENGLRSLLDSFSSILCGLKALGESVNSWSTFHVTGFYRG